MRIYIFAKHASQTPGVSNKTTTTQTHTNKKAKGSLNDANPWSDTKTMCQISLKACRNCGRQTQRKTTSTLG